MKKLHRKQVVLVASLAVVVATAVFTLACYITGDSPFIRGNEEFDENHGYYTLHLTKGEPNKLSAKRKFISDSMTLDLISVGRNVEQVQITFCGKGSKQILGTAMLGVGEKVAVLPDTNKILVTLLEGKNEAEDYVVSFQFVEKPQAEV